MSDNTQIQQANFAMKQPVGCGSQGSPRTVSTNPASGGARRDRTDDLMLAKHALSQLSYGPLGVQTPE